MSLEKSSGRGVKSHYGPRVPFPNIINYFNTPEPHQLESNPRFYNPLISEYPEVRVYPFLVDGTQNYTSTTLTNATFGVDLDKLDPMTGMPMGKLTINAGASAVQYITYNSVTRFHMDLQDVWFVSVYFPEIPPSGAIVQLEIADTTSISGGNYRYITFTRSNEVLHQGYNILSFMHKEDQISGTEYGRVGTSNAYEWTNLVSQTDTTPIQAIRLMIRNSPASGTSTDVYVGSVQTVKAGWSKSVVMLGVDDAPVTFYNIAVPIIEKFGWKSVINSTVSNTFKRDDSISLNQLRELRLRGHEIWGHSSRHDNLDTSTLAEKTTSLTNAKQFWNANGFPTAAKYMVYPFGAYDNETISLLASLGYKLSCSTQGLTNSTLIPGINPYYINRTTIERQNSWEVDSILNGGILKGSAILAFGHHVYEGGGTSNTYPQATSFYADHLIRWCELIKSYEEQGRCIVTTPLEYYKMVGIDPETDSFAE